MENKFKVKVEMLQQCALIVDDLNSSIERYQNEIAEQSELPEEERSWRYEDIMLNNPARIEAYKRIISHLEKLL